MLTTPVAGSIVKRSASATPTSAQVGEPLGAPPDSAGGGDDHGWFSFTVTSARPETANGAAGTTTTLIVSSSAWEPHRSTLCEHRGDVWAPWTVRVNSSSVYDSGAKNTRISLPASSLKYSGSHGPPVCSQR